MITNLTRGYRLQFCIIAMQCPEDRVFLIPDGQYAVRVIRSEESLCDASDLLCEYHSAASDVLRPQPVDAMQKTTQSNTRRERVVRYGRWKALSHGKLTACLAHSTSNSRHD